MTEAVRQYRSEPELRYLVGTGVAAAAIYHLRESLDAAGFGDVRIVASSGFGPVKCKVMASVSAPIDVIGTGSFLPERWDEPFAPAGGVTYGVKPPVKGGRQFVFRPQDLPGTPTFHPKG